MTSEDEINKPVENLFILAKALLTIAHSTNHVGIEYTALSEVAEAVLREVLPLCEKITGQKCGVTIQHDRMLLRKVSGAGFSKRRLARQGR